MYVLLSIALSSGVINISAARTRKNPQESNSHHTVYRGVTKSKTQKVTQAPASKTLSKKQVEILENYNKYYEFLKKYQNQKLDNNLKNEFQKLNTIIQTQNTEHINTKTKNGKLNRYAQINLEYMLYLHGIQGPINTADFMEHKKLTKELFKQ